MLDSVCILTEMTDQMQHGKACKRSSELMLFSSCLNTNVCYLTGEAWKEKKRGKKEQIFLQSTFGSQCGKNKHSRSLRDTICKKMKIPKGADNVVSALKTDGVGAHHLFEQIQCSITDQREKPTAQLLCCLKGE